MCCRGYGVVRPHTVLDHCAMYMLYTSHELYRVPIALCCCSVYVYVAGYVCMFAGHTYVSDRLEFYGNHWNAYLYCLMLLC